MSSRTLARPMLCAVILGTSLSLSAAEILDDETLDGITAGSAPDALQRAPVAFEIQRTTARGKRIGASGNAQVVNSLDLSNFGLLRLEDNAQGNLRALVNTNAVNSTVQVLINLNINIDSTINSITQVNSAARPR